METAGGTGCEADPDFLGIHVAKIGKKENGRGCGPRLPVNSRYLWICSI
jgi:hypothetical protein